VIHLSSKPQLHASQDAEHFDGKTSLRLLALYLIVIATSLGLSIYFTNAQMSVNELWFRTDAGGYLIVAETPFIAGDFRSSGYVVFLQTLLWIAAIFDITLKPVSYLILAAQWLVFAGASFALSWQVSRKTNLRLIVFSGLILNLVMLPYMGISMTESLAVSTFLMSLAIWLSPASPTAKSLFIGVAAGFAAALRPANLWIAAFWFLFLAVSFLRRKVVKSYIQQAMFTLGVVLPLIPQISINWLFNKHLPFPVEIANIQLYLSTRFTESAFFIHKPHCLAFSVVNPFMTARSGDFHWLSIDGASYLLFKVLSFFIYHSYYCYERASSLFEMYSELLFSSFCLWFGVLGIASLWKRIGRQWQIGLILGLISCMAMHLGTTLEDRFTIFLYVLLFPFGLLYFTQPHWKQNKVALLCFPVVFLLVNLYSSICLALSPGFADVVRLGIIKH
jgi:hypothetical protein